MGEGLRAWALVIVVVALLGVFPVATRRDSYPISDLPMFSSRRSATESVSTAVAIGDHDQVWRLSPRLIAATDEVIIAAVTVSRSVNAGTSHVLCEEIAQRVSTSGPADAHTIEVVTEQYDAIRWFEGDREPLDRWVHASCPVSPAVGETS